MQRIRLRQGEASLTQTLIAQLRVVTSLTQFSLFLAPAITI